MYLHSVRAVAAVVHGGRDGHDQRRHAVTHHVEVAAARVLALEHLHQHDVELHALQEHPGERRQEEEVQQGGEDGAGDLPLGLTETGERGENGGKGGKKWSMTLSFLCPLNSSSGPEAAAGCLPVVAGGSSHFRQRARAVQPAGGQQIQESGAKRPRAIWSSSVFFLRRWPGVAT